MKDMPRLESRQAVATPEQKRAESEQIARDIADAVARGVQIQVIPLGVSALEPELTSQQRNLMSGRASGAVFNKMVGDHV